MKTSNNNTNLTSHQQEIFNNIISMIESKVTNVLKSTNINDYLISLAGAAGTGKTYLTTQIAKYLIQKNKKDNNDFSFTITAPTHKAVGVLAGILSKDNINASCKTIHSFLGIKPFRDYNTGEEKFTIDKTKKHKDTTSILIVDESSMIGKELYEYILEAIEDNRVNLVIFIGDPYQLLPIDNSKNNIFEIKNSFTLTQVVRQAKDSYIIKLATKLRDRIENKNYINILKFFEENMEKEIQLFHNKNDFLEDFYKDELWYNQNKILATYKNKDVDAFNKTIRNKYWEQKNMPAIPVLRKGDKLRFIDAYSVDDISIYHNGQEIELVNAEQKFQESLGIYYWECQDKDDKTQQVFRVVDPDSMLVFNEKLKSISKKAKKAKFPENKKLWKAFFLTKDMFANVQYIHSSTIHKLQGSTYDIAYVDMFSLSQNKHMSDDEKYRLLYVAITRASKDIKLFLPTVDGDINISIQENMKSQINLKQKHKSIDDMLEFMNI